MKKTKTASPFSSAAYKADPYALYAEWRREPVQETTLPDGTPVYVVTRYADVEAGLKDPRLVKNVRNVRERGLLDMLGLGKLQNNNMLRADPPAHTRLRSLANEAFKPKYIKQLRGHIEQITHDLLDKVQSAGKMDLIADFAFPLPITVIGEMLGVPEKDHVKFHKWSGQLVASGSLSSDRPHISVDLLQLVSYVRRLIADHRKNPRPDVIGQLLEAEQNGDHLNNRELISTVVLLLIAGHETTVNLIGNGMLALLLQPEEMEKLKQNPALIKPAIEEILRIANPVQLVNRYAAEDIAIAGVKIPRGSHLLLLLASANHDPSYVAEPEKLNVTREEARHVAFSQGIHYCLGAPLARAEGEIAFAALLERMPNMRLAVPREKIEWRPAIELRGLNSLPVLF